MRQLKVSQIWSVDDCKYFLIPQIIENIFKLKLIWTKPKDCDILIVGTYKKFGKIKKKLSIKYNFLNNEFIQNLEKKVFFRKNKPITLFYSRENERSNLEETDFSVGTDFNYDDDKNYLRIPVWKDYCDWSEFGLSQPTNGKLNSKRFGEFYSINRLQKPSEQSFLTKPKKLCCFFSYINRPRDQFLKLIKSKFLIDCYGPAFDNKIKDHNNSNFIKLNIMKNYFSNFCPENEIYPGWYTEKVPDAYLASTLPITWADQNISYDFNKHAFININDYKISELNNLFDELKSDEFLKKFQNEPLITTKLNLDEEIAFTKKILNKLNVIS
jgi:hypothetical protein